MPGGYEAGKLGKKDRTESYEDVRGSGSRMRNREDQNATNTTINNK